MTYHSRQPFQKPATGAEIERLLHHMPTVARLAEETWARGFAQSVLKQSRRRGWTPSPKQLPVMREMVSALFTQAEGSAESIQVIED